MYRVNPAIFVAFVVALLTGCSVAPTVEYTRITSASQLKGDEFDTFSFRRSMLKVDAKKDAKGVLQAPPDISVTSLPAESSDFKIALRRADKPGIRTNLNITKIENTDLVKELGTEVVDSRVELVTKIGGILVKLAPLAFSAAEGLTADALPMNLNVQAIMVGGKVLEKAATDIEAGDGVRIDFGAIPVDAKPIEVFPDGQAVNAFYYSACRVARVKVALKDVRYEQTVKIADPRYFQTVGLPLKGKVTMHSECGASVTSDKDTGVKSSADVVDALVAQGKAIKDAIDAAKKDNK